MIVSALGIELTPGNCGEDCLANGEHSDENGNLIECCCDECDYLLCCTSTEYYPECINCGVKKCSNYRLK